MSAWRYVENLDTNIWLIEEIRRRAFKLGEVDIWIFSQMQNSQMSSSLKYTLHPNELERADKFYTEALRNQYIVRRGMLRHILAAYLQLSASEIAITYSEHGKPYLVNQALQFNVSHSSGLALIAVTKHAKMGIDIEKVQAIPDMRRVAEHHFSELEQSHLFALPDDQQTQAFYRCWTEKEAVIKADGRGLGMALSSFDVTLSPNDAPKLLRIGEDETVSERWQMATIPVNDDYQAALVLIEKTLILNFFQAHPKLLSYTN